MWKFIYFWIESKYLTFFIIRKIIKDEKQKKRNIEITLKHKCIKQICCWVYCYMISTYYSFEIYAWHMNVIAPKKSLQVQQTQQSLQPSLFSQDLKQVLSCGSSLLSIFETSRSTFGAALTEIFHQKNIKLWIIIT